MGLILDGANGFRDTGNGALGLPYGTTAQRPSAPANGFMRYNTDTNSVEYYANGSWSGTQVGSYDIEVLLVAGGGGGGGGGWVCGGGGGGGVLYIPTVPVISGTSYLLAIGAGGAGGIKANGGNGGNTIGFSQTAVGGGGGSSNNVQSAGLPGGSGGGANTTDTGGTPYSGGAGTSGQGFAGGNQTSGTNSGFPVFLSAGGGGAGGLGGSGSVGSRTCGSGGPGISHSFSGAAILYSAGGGGGGPQYPGNNNYWSYGGGGGSGGGGAGSYGAPGANATNYGCGGGGGGGYFNGSMSDNVGGNGYAGIIFVRYPGVQRATGGTSIITTGGFTTHTFTTSSTFIA